ncbi:uncharacterized protein SPPG_01652 [Spizellomyces punctatus DAOM BR117]|uniref:Response regulatory domain-containing protein n=1 Tax=Spizellomyces punctatus (strain DAOM BR117) TaxID=645134 RepID=A0A0L0HTJ4_SPIPD|nr:uncharacterized protein SPPG_01652 [Spizellomyces punctatus DAOM BR117]KND04220.1 hypothetical protein SPPG_01652 [Spizellomyces punctatus DAOM BR117]|eukprot:XP_016612259.1 hypothetical protein SPPG_01652 [Spizellomyces punctatus DAOM BR117]
MARADDVDLDATHTDLREQELSLPTILGRMPARTRPAQREDVLPKRTRRHERFQAPEQLGISYFASGLQACFSVVAWGVFFFVLAHISRTCRVGKLILIWLPTGALASAMMRTDTAVRYVLALFYVLIVMGSMAMEFPIATAGVVAVSSGVVGVLISTVMRWAVPNVSKGLETLRGIVIFSCLIPVSALLETCCFALGMSSLQLLAGVSYKQLVFNMFPPVMLGLLVTCPFLTTMDKRKAIHVVWFWKQGYMYEALWFTLSIGLAVGLPFTFASVPNNNFGPVFFYMFPLSMAVALTTGMSGLCVYAAVAITSVLSANIVLVQPSAPVDTDYTSFRTEMLQRLQYWVCVMMTAGLMLAAAVAERNALLAILERKERERERNNRDESLKRPSAALAASESSMVLGFVCNELRKPIEDIVRMTEPMALVGEDAFAAASVSLCGRAIKRLGEHILQLLTDAYDFARIGNGLVTPKVSVVNLPELLEQITTAVRAQYGNRKIQLEVRLAPGLPQYVLVDESCLRRVLQVLCANACKHVSRRSRIIFDAVLSTKYSRGGEKRDTVDVDMSITVTDWVLEHPQADILLRPYAHLSATTTATADLSLAVASGFARCMGGRVVVFGQHGRGTVFSCKFPLRVLERPPSLGEMEMGDLGVSETSSIASTPPASLPTTLERPSRPPLLRQLTGAAGNAAGALLTKDISRRLSLGTLRRRSRDYAAVSGNEATMTVEHTTEDYPPDTPPETHIGEIEPVESGPSDFKDSKKLVLVVDDSSISRAILVRMLQRYPQLDVHEAANGSRALQLCLAQTFSIIFMDMEMPEMTGPAVALRLRHEGLTAPIILTTANTLGQDQLRQSGINELLVKPITKENIKNVLSKYGVIEELEPTYPPETPLSSAPTTMERSETADLLPKHPKDGITGYESPKSTPSSSLSRPSSLFRPQHLLVGNAAILVVDDNPIGRALLKKALTQILPGRDIVEAADGSEAVARCAAGEKFAIIYMDLEMPHMDGDIAATRIRNMRVASGGPPIVAVTGHGLDSEAYHSLRAAGINEAISKPVAREVLVDTLRRYGILGISPSPSGTTSPEFERKDAGFAPVRMGSSVSESVVRSAPGSSRLMTPDLGAAVRALRDRERLSPLSRSRSPSPERKQPHRGESAEAGRRSTISSGSSPTFKLKGRSGGTSPDTASPPEHAANSPGDLRRILLRGGSPVEIPRRRLASAPDVGLSRNSGVE